MKLHKVIICGDREWHENYVAAVRRVVRQLKRQHGRRLVIIEGGAPSVDTLAKEIGIRENVHVAEVEALWATRHGSAGPQRNDVMLGLGPHEVIGLHRNWRKSRGTKDMCDKAERAGVKVQRIKVKS
jgi:hypothetical protein